MLVKYLEGPSAGMTLNVADTAPYLQSGKYGLVDGGSTSGASLAGTMATPEKAPLPSVPTPQTDSRTLPQAPTGSIANFKNAIQNISRLAYDQGPSSTDILKGYESAGLKLTTPGAIGGAISMDTQSRSGAIGDVYRQTIDMIKEQEVSRREKEAKDAQWAQQLISIMPKSVFGSLTPEEFTGLRTGNPSSSLIQKIQTAITTEAASEKPSIIGQDESGNTQYGTFDTVSKTWKPISVTQPAPTGPTSVNKSKIISAGGKTFDFSTYATDPNWGNAVNNKLSQIGKFNSLDDVSAYIKKRAPNSPVTAQMVAATSQKYGLPWELIVALADHESGLGTLGAGARTFNPGNVGNVDSGATKNMGDWQTGLDAMGAQIARRAISKEQANQLSQGPKTKEQEIAESIFSGTSTMRLTDVPTKQKAAVGKELEKLKQQAISSGDIAGIIRASAGGKETDATFNQSFEKALNVVGQLGELQEALKKEETGPIVGIIRSNYPYDTKAQLIKSQLTAIVPNLARGVYGEVGVLTDNDVALYSKTIPNLKSTKDVNNLILGATVRSIQRSLENKLKVQAGFGRDVSGILSTYEEVKALADKLSGSVVVSQGITLPKPAK